jgi:hypothetical protein
MDEDNNTFDDLYVIEKNRVVPFNYKNFTIMTCLG